jgi:hypothetical protein
MNVSAHTPGTLRFWGPTGLVGAASAGIVAVLLTAVVTAPASSAPGTRVPLGPAPSSGPGPADAPILVPCFMNRYDWAFDLVGPPPMCRL